MGVHRHGLAVAAATMGAATMGAATMGRARRADAVMVDEAAAMVRERVWSADPALADAGLPVLAIGTRRSSR